MSEKHKKLKGQRETERRRARTEGREGEEGGGRGGGKGREGEGGGREEGKGQKAESERTEDSPLVFSYQYICKQQHSHLKEETLTSMKKTFSKIKAWETAKKTRKKRHEQRER